uniref:Putative LAGLIDADG 1 endonuclease n=1 Tax=Magnusiomyces magnusii TaxID=43963 RepID=K9L3S1_MAGMU|nr:putative LAGLIDADG 1 endonuclease [Magnusiomyces magnusii]
MLGAPIVFNTTPNSTKLKTYSTKPKLEPYWVTGFADAESTFSIRIRSGFPPSGRISNNESRLFGIRLHPIFSIELHIRDIDVLHKIKDFFKVGSVKERIRGGKSSAIYSVQSINDIVTVIIPHFIKYPLITQKQADFILFSSAVKLINNEEHLTEKGLKKILSIRASMNKGLSARLKELFPNIIGVKRPTISNQTIKSPFWLVGFVDGEGCFYIKITKLKKISLAFLLYQHSRDSYLFNIIKDYLDCGIIEKKLTRPDEITLVIYSLKDLVKKVLPFFEKYPLITQKQKDLNALKKVSSLMLNKEHLTEKGLKKILLIKELKKA